MKFRLVVSISILVMLATWGCGENPVDEVSESMGAAEVAEPSEQDLSAFPGEMTDTLGNEFVLIEPGSFLMGSNEFDEREKPQHPVTLTKPFYMARYEVTQELYERLMGENPSEVKDPARPVTNLSWYAAVAFCEKLSEIEGVTYRLPTEAEWEYAYRAGTETTYYWGDDFDEIYLSEANPWGLFNMAGSVKEYCSDWLNPYPDSEVTDPDGGEKTDKQKVVRGGSDKYGGVPINFSATARGFVDPDHSFYDDIGIRLVLDIAIEEE